MMKSLLLAVLCSVIAGAALPSVAAAKSPPHKAAPVVPSVTYDGTHPVALREGDFSVTIDTAPGSRSDLRAFAFTGTYQGQPAFSARIDYADDAEVQATARVVRLDPNTPLPQIVMTGYSSDEHCCTATKIATADAAGHWQIVDAPLLDGDQGYVFLDIDHDGTAEMISNDQNFLYGFDCYACSYPPARIAKFAGSQITDVTNDPKYRGYLRLEVASMEKIARQDRSQWHKNGFLAGWVAAKSLIGEVDDAWKKMLASYDRNSDFWPMQECTTGEAVDKCPKDKLRDVTFPQALAKQLVQEGYPTPKRVR